MVSARYFISRDLVLQNSSFCEVHAIVARDAEVCMIFLQYMFSGDCAFG